MKLGAKPPRRPITLAVHPVEQAWRESTVCWNRQPPFSARPLASAQVAARAGVVRIELTELVEAWRSGARANHGILLRDANARPGALLADALFADALFADALFADALLVVGALLLAALVLVCARADDVANASAMRQSAIAT